ncbi:ankyrin repeat domain-containing protein 30B-like [Macaca nemestrina]|uniref:ankyrin repeat domain-containing protein 30B-like n=1 Tax=Macaca nemestrina TaxID=9545 RepID=UPI0039B8A4A7
MQWLSPVGGGNDLPTGQERPSPFSQLVYTNNDSYIIQYGDLREIHKAASRGQVSKLQKMTVKKKTINLNVKDARKRTALHWACVNGHAEVVTFLVDRKCQLDVLDGENRTPLMKALQCQREDCANILVDSGAGLNIVDVYGNTALHYAVYNKNLSVVAKLLSHGAVVETQNKASLTPLLLAITKRSEQIVEFLLTKNANANAVNRFKCTALMLAVCHGSSEIVGMLLLRNVDVFAEDTCGMTAVRYAIACGFDHIHQQLLEYIRKLPKNAGPAGTSAGTPDEGAPLAERTPATAESLVEKTPDEAAPLVEATPDTAESLVEKTPDEAAPLVEATPDTAESLVEKSPDEAAPLVEETPATAESLVEKTPDEAAPDEAAPLVEGTPDKIECLGKATSGKLEQLAEETPRKITRPAKETYGQFICPVTGRLRKIAWEKKPRPVKTERVAVVTSNKTKVLEKGTSKMIACPTKETSTKASTNDQRFPTESKQEEDEENSCDSESLFESSTKVQVYIPESTDQSVMKHVNREVEEFPEKPSDFKPAVDMQNSVPNEAFEWKNEQTLRPVHVSSVESIFSHFGKQTIENSQSTKLEEDFNLATKEGATKTVTGQQENDIGIIEQAPQDQKNKMPTSESGQKEDIKSPSDSEIISKSAGQNYMCLPGAIYQDDVETINHKIEDQRFPTESKQQEDKENAWDSGSLFESATKIQVCTPESIYQSVTKHINREVEEPPEKSSAFKPATEIQNSFPNEAFKCKKEQPLTADQMIPSESKQKDNEENSWDLESDRETVSQKDVCLPKATPQKEFHTISGKLEDQMIPSESKQKDEEENSWDLESDRETVSQKDVCLPKATPQKEFHTISGKLEDQMIPSESKKKAEEENSWDLESDRETVSQKDVCLPRTAPQKEFHMISGKLEDQMVPSESKQKDEEENSWDLESDRETVSQKDVCLPKATPQKEFHMISEKLEESPHKDGLLKPTCGMKVSIPNKALEVKDIQTFKAVDVSSVESTFSPFGKPTTENSQPTKLEEDFSLATKEEATKTVTGQQENDIGIIEQAPEDRTNKIPTSESRQKEYTESSDSEIISVSDTQNYVCLTEATYQKEIKTINGKIEESTEKPSDFEPAVEMQNSVPNKALERRNKQTLRADNMLTLKSGKETYAESRWSSKNFKQSVSESAAQNYTCLPEATYQEEVKNINGKLKDSTSLSKSLDAVPSCKRARELKKDHCEKLTAKIERMKNKFCVLKKELSETKEINSQLENQTVKWEQELCSVRLTLNQEEEKRRNANILNEKLRKELGRIEEQHRKELEVKQELEQALRIQDMEVKSVRSNLSQVSHTHENENYLLHENRMLKKEIAMLKLEIAKLKHQHQEKENKYFKDIKILKEKNAELQMTLKLKEESLTKMASQYSGQLKVLMAENTMLTSKLKEKQDKEIREREIESYHPRLASAVQDRDQIVTSRKSQGLAFHIAGDASLQGKINVDVNNTIYNNKVLHQPLAEAQRKSKSLKNNLNYAGDALRENTLVSEHAQRERDETQYQMKKAEHMYQNEQDNVNIHNEQQESLEQKLFQLQSKNLWLRQQLIHAHKKADNKSKITINIQLLKRKMQHHPLKEKNEEIFNYINHLKDCIYKYEKEKEEREVIVKQLQKRLADLNKQCVSDLTRTYTNYHINLKDEI